MKRYPTQWQPIPFSQSFFKVVDAKYLVDSEYLHKTELRDLAATDGPLTNGVVDSLHFW